MLVRQLARRPGAHGFLGVALRPAQVAEQVADGPARAGRHGNGQVRVRHGGSQQVRLSDDL